MIPKRYEELQVDGNQVRLWEFPHDEYLGVLVVVLKILSDLQQGNKNQISNL